MPDRRGFRLIVVGLTTALVAGLVPQLPVEAAPSATQQAARPTVTAMTPRSGSLQGGDPLTLSGTGFSTATKVLFGSVATTKITAKSSTHLRVRTPKHLAGRVAIRVVTSGGTSAATPAAEYAFAAAPKPLHWMQATSVDPDGGGIEQPVSCVSASFCAAVNRDEAATYDGVSWTAVPLGGSNLQLADVSCASTTLCVAVGRDGDGNEVLSAYNGSKWGKLVVLAPSKRELLAFGVVSCAPGTTYCIAAGSGSGHVDVEYNAGKITPFTETSGMDAVDCVTRSFCMFHLTRGTGEFAQWNGSTVAAQYPNALAANMSLTCVSTSHCLALDPKGKYAVFDGTAWSAPSAAVTGGGYRGEAVSCAVADYCLATLTNATGNDLITFNGSTWSAPQAATDQHAELTAVSCWAANSCITADMFGDVYRLVTGAVTGPQRTVAHTGELSDVSCASATMCMAVDRSGNAVRYDGHRWGAPQQIDRDHVLLSVSCPTTTFCAAVDGLTDDDYDEVFEPYGNVVTYNGTTWSTPTRIDDTGTGLDDVGLVDVSCASASFCVAIDSIGRAVTYRDGTWTAPAPVIVKGPRRLSAVSCPTTTYCVVVDWDGHVVYGDGTTWDAPRTVGSTIFEDVSCSGPDYCALVGSDGLLVRNQQLLGHALPDIGPAGRNHFDAVSCGATYYCVTGGYDDEAYYSTSVVNGSAIGPAKVSFKGARTDCVSASFCAAIAFGRDTVSTGTA